jgi:hypothetical protein
MEKLLKYKIQLLLWNTQGLTVQDGIIPSGWQAMLESKGFT